MGIAGPLLPDAACLLAAVLLDLALGDPQVRWHPIRLVGRAIQGLEDGLRGLGLDGYGGGVALGLSASALAVAAAVALVLAGHGVHPALGVAMHVLVAYSMLALRDLLDHVWAVEAAARRGDLAAARHATSMFVARDTSALDLAGCRRAGIESLAENFTDGYASPVFWYALGGLPGLVAFKVFSTLDSMVGNRSPRYLRFGWFSARTDDVLNWIPARLSALALAAVALVLPHCSAARALAVGWSQHALVPGPNSGWSEAALAGAIRRRLVGPIYLGGTKVTDLWLGDARDPPAGESPSDVPRAMVVTALAGVLCVALAAGWLFSRT